MYLQSIEGVLPGQRVKIKYDCNGGFDRCGKEREVMLKDAEKNAKAHNGEHVCRQCQLRANNPASNKEVREKMKKTCLVKYGTAMPLNSKENITKRQEMFKDQEFVQQRTQKSKKTSLKKYGVEHVMHLDEFKEKQKTAMQERYGVDYPYQSPEIMAKMKASNQEKYGVENVASLPEVQIKMAKTTLERYGVEHYNELPEMKDYLREHCREWLAESWANPWAKGIVRPEEWNQKQRETVIQLVLDGKWKSGPKNCIRGYYASSKCKRKNPLFRSSYELRVHRFLDLCDDVEFYDYEPFAIPYHQNGEDKWYIPDFIVKYKNKNKLEIVEVKPNYLIGSDDVEFKKIGADELVAQYKNNLIYNIWGTKTIEKFGFNLDELLLLPEVTLL